jgi:hypothetical protein
MSRAHYFQAITDGEGNLVPNATVAVHDPITLQYISQTMYLTDNGSTPLPNPLAATGGVIDFYLDEPDRLLLRIDAPGYGSYQLVVDVLPPADRLVLSDIPLHFSTPPEPGKVVNVGSDGSLVFGNSPVGLTPKTTINSWDFATGTVPGAWGFSYSGTGISTSYTGEIVDDPVSTYTKAYHFNGNASGTFTTTPLVTKIFWGATLPDTGTMTFFLKLNGSSGFRFLVDDAPVYTTISAASWTPVKIDAIVPGAHTFAVEYSLTGNTAGSEMFLAGMLLTSGGVVSAHYHDGTGLHSLALGQNSVASADDTTAVGDSATANSADTTAIGYSAQALAESATAVGSKATATGSGSTVIGYAASSLSAQSVVVGYQSSATRVGSVVLGYSAISSGDYNVAVGYQAAADAASNAVAIGKSAQAHASGSVAIGQNAVVGASHNNSVAIGKDVQTTSANQIMIGDATYTLYIPGALRAQGDVTIGASTSRIGFFGSLGTTRPTVTGSRNGNVALNNILAALANMGLIINGTTA